MSKNWKHIHVNNKLYFTYFLWFENHYMLLFCVTPSPIYSSQFICNLHHLRNLWCRFSKPPTSNFHCSDLHTMYYLLPISVHSSNHLLFLSQLLLEKSFSFARWVWRHHWVRARPISISKMHSCDANWLFSQQFSFLSSIDVTLEGRAACCMSALS